MPTWAWIITGFAIAGATLYVGGFCAAVVVAWRLRQNIASIFKELFQ